MSPQEQLEMNVRISCLQIAEKLDSVKDADSLISEARKLKGFIDGAATESSLKL